MSHQVESPLILGEHFTTGIVKTTISLPMLKKIATRHGFAIDDGTIEQTHIEMYKETKEWPKDLLEALKIMGYEFEVINSSEICRVRVWQMAK